MPASGSIGKCLPSTQLGSGVLSAVWSTTVSFPWWHETCGLWNSPPLWLRVTWQRLIFADFQGASLFRRLQKVNYPLLQKPSSFSQFSPGKWPDTGFSGASLGERSNMVEWGFLLMSVLVTGFIGRLVTVWILTGYPMPPSTDEKQRSLKTLIVLGSGNGHSLSVVGATENCWNNFSE